MHRRVPIALAFSALMLMAAYAAISVRSAGSVTSVSDVLAGRVAAGQDVTLEDTRVVAVATDTSCPSCATWAKVTTVTLESASDHAQITAVLKKVGGNLLQFKKQNGVPLVGWTIRLSGTVAHSGSVWSIDPAKEWVEFGHVGTATTAAAVASGSRPVGEYVWLDPVTVTEIFHSTDGDYHVQVRGSDGTSLTTEITPPHEDELPTPAVGDSLTIFGMVLYDSDHGHWEVHPIRCLRAGLCAGGAAPSGPPGAPLNLEASAGDGRVQLGWMAPATQGGSPVTAYRVYRAVGTAPLAQWAEVSVRALTDDTVTNGQRYRYAISAVNAQGEGPRSAEVAAVPGPGGATEWLAEDFEEDIDAWVLTSAPGGSAWKLTPAQAYEGATSITCGDGTTYKPSSDCTLQTPALDLRRATAANLTFASAGRIAGLATTLQPLGPVTAGDAGVVEGSADGGATWLPLASGGNVLTTRWTEVTVPLDALLGAADARVRFHFTSDAAVELEGWFVDAVRVDGLRGPPAAPVGLVASRVGTSVHLAWSAPSDAGTAATYRIYRGATTGGLAHLADAGPALAFDDPAPDAATPWYGVTAVVGLEGPAGTVRAPDPTSGPLFEDKFETGAPGWTIVKNGPTGSSKWNLVTTQSVSPTHSYTAGGGTSYGASTDAELISPSVAIGGAAAPKLKFMHKVGGEAGKDFGRVFVSADGGPWTQIGGPYVGVGSWTAVSLDLPASATSVKVEFRFVSDAATQNAAWFVDDVQILAS